MNNRFKVLILGIYIERERRSTGGPMAVFSNLVDSICRLSERQSMSIEVVSQSYWSTQQSKCKTEKRKVDVVPIFRIGLLLKFLTGMIRKRYTILNVQGVSELGAIVSFIGKLAGSTVVYSCHGIAKLEKVLGRRVPWRLILLERIIVSNSDYLITVSNIFKKVIHKYFKVPSNEIFVIYNGLDDFWVNEQESRSREYLDIKNEYLLFVGELSESKGFDILLQAFFKLKRKHRDIKLVVVGKDPKDKFRKTLKEYTTSIIHFNQVDKVTLRDLYRYALAFILPSKMDSFPLTVLEAMSQGIPVIISQNVGVSELVEDRKNALIVKAGDVDDLVTKVELVLNDKEFSQKMGIEAKKFTSKLGWNIVLSNHLELLKHLYCENFSY